MDGSGAHPDPVVAAQDAGHPSGHDYDKGSPHLRHPRLRSMIEGRLRALLAVTISRRGECRVVEVGGGHGTFTACLVEAGAHVTVTETSSASAESLVRQFGGDDRVEVIHDRTGEEVLHAEREWDLAVIISVLHHIPDYLSFLERLSLRITPGGGVFSVQDPIFYPRRSALTHRADRAAYLAWRVFQGDYAKGLATRWRRLRGAYDDAEPADLIEYHVVREGVDDEAIREVLATRFASVEVFRYWSTQAPVLQRLGDRTPLLTTFGVQATGRHPAP